jgi:hypothetical protein
MKRSMMYVRITTDHSVIFPPAACTAMAAPLESSQPFSKWIVKKNIRSQSFVGTINCNPEGGVGKILDHGLNP